MEIVIKIFKLIYKKNLCCMFYRWKGNNIFSCQASTGSQRVILKTLDEESMKKDVIKTMMNTANGVGFRWEQSAVKDAET